MELRPTPVEWPSIGADGQFIEQFVRTRFSDENFDSIHERADRVLEEAAEYHQAVYGNATEEARKRADLILNRVHSRDIGEPAQEIAGLLACVLAAARVMNLDLREALYAEYQRVADMPADHFRKKYLEKVAAGTSR